MIRSELDVLLERVEDPALGEDLQTQIDRLKQRRSFGLVFEQHIPERVRLRVAIAHTTGAARDAYTRVREQTASPEVVTVELRANERAATKDRDGAALAVCRTPVRGRRRALSR